MPTYIKVFLASILSKFLIFFLGKNKLTENDGVKFNETLARNFKRVFRKIILILLIGEMAEWLKAHAWKACKRETVSRVRIPLSPPLIIHIQLKRVLR